jgi:ABC-type Na+ efflux pump permease subunit
VEELLTSQNMSNASAYLEPFAYQVRDISGKAGGGVTENLMAQMLPLLLFLSVIFAGQFMAESVAGERERKTIELLLSTPVSKRDVLVGKVLGVAALVIVQVSLWFGAIFAISAYTGQQFVNPLGLAQALVYFSVAVLMFCTLGVIISCFTKTIRDAQQYFGIGVVPLYIFAFIPLEVIPEPIASILQYTPIVSVAIASKQALTGKMSVLSVEGIAVLLISFITLVALVYIGSKIFEKKVVGGL